MAGIDECQFHHKVGACRHGNKCVRKHTPPESSRAIILNSMHIPPSKFAHSHSHSHSHAHSFHQDSPALARSAEVPDDPEMTAFVRDLFVEIALIAPIEEIFFAANESPHLRGNVYVALSTAEGAEKVCTNINARWFDGRPVFANYLPSQTLGSAVCRDGANCSRQLDCNYVHPREVSPATLVELYAAQRK